LERWWRDRQIIINLVVESETKESNKSEPKGSEERQGKEIDYMIPEEEESVQRRGESQPDDPKEMDTQAQQEEKVIGGIDADDDLGNEVISNILNVQKRSSERVILTNI
jgi:hypothetical protein